MPPCLIGMEACVGAHHLSRRLHSLGHDARLMPGKYVKPYRKGQKNDFRASTPPASVAPTLCAKTPNRASKESASRVGVGNGKNAEGCPSGERAAKSSACPGPNPNTRPPPTHATSVHPNR